jgi:hypothetical protein
VSTPGVNIWCASLALHPSVAGPKVRPESSPEVASCNGEFHTLSPPLVQAPIFLDLSPYHTNPHALIGFEREGLDIRFY